MSKFILFLLIGLSLPVYGQKIYDVGNPTFYNYSSKIYDGIYKHRSKIHEITGDVNSINKNVVGQEWFLNNNLFKHILDCIGFCDDIAFAMSVFTVSDGTEVAVNYIIDNIYSKLEYLKKNKQWISSTLSDVENNQLIYLGNDARKEVDKIISLTEEWIQEARKL